MLAQHTWSGSRNQKHKKGAVLVRGGWQQCTALSLPCHIFQAKASTGEVGGSPACPRGACTGPVLHTTTQPPTSACYNQHNWVGTEVGRCRCACWSPAGHQRGLSAHSTRGGQGNQKRKGRRGSAAVLPGRRILWVLLSAGLFALLTGKPTPVKSLCCGLFPGLPFACSVAPHKVRRVVIPKPRAQAPLLQGRAKTQEYSILWQSCHPRKATPHRPWRVVLGEICLNAKRRQWEDL